MATAVKNEKKMAIVKRFKYTEEVVQEESVTLELTMEEARVLRTVTGAILGSSGNTRRKITNSIHTELTKIFGRFNYKKEAYSGNIIFKD